MPNLIGHPAYGTVELHPQNGAGEVRGLSQAAFRYSSILPGPPGFEKTVLLETFSYLGFGKTALAVS